MLKSFANFAAVAALALAAPALAQVQTVDPNDAYEQSGYGQEPATETSDDAYQDWQGDPAPSSEPEWTIPEPQANETVPAESYSQPTQTVQAAPGSTIPREDVFTAAEDLFGRGAEGLGGILENILRDQGEPTAYISGQEAGGALVFGVRYGSGTMRHQIEGDRVVYWTGPSLGFDVGADANKVFVLVYNLHDSQELFRRYPGAEGNAYFVGGFTAQYLRRGDVVLIPIRLGVGLRLGVNAGYMRFSERNRWVPF
ncbi:DUF1134 domain-containing protein [Sphingosinicella terrae]|uniref:DUF1134 domain-containing protein n=1 Tax=Sphingosinicella terrae TaxID=2172047 RepID=UPI000E0D5991|nr:DUF1134 domain-containing protein [Sphingosinicella terrae]